MKSQLDFIFKADDESSVLMNEAHIRASELRNETQKEVQKILQSVNIKIKEKEKEILAKSNGNIELKKDILEQKTNKTIEQIKEIIDLNISSFNEVIINKIIAG